MSRRKATAQREPNGRIQRVPTISAAEARRLRDAALSGLRDLTWGTELGRLYLAGKVTSEEFAAGKRWAEEVSLYLTAIQAPSPDPRAMDFNRNGGSPVDPDSNEGAREARRHQRAVEKFDLAHKELVSTGMLSERVVRSVCENGVMLVGHDELIKLKSGLSTLAAFWGLTDSRKSMSDRHS